MPDGVRLAFPILGRAFTAVDVPPILTTWLRDTWDYPDRGASRADYDISLSAVATAPAERSGSWTLVEGTLPGGAVTLRSRGSCWRAGDGQAGVELEVQASGSRIYLWGWTDAAEPAPLYLALYLMMAEALRVSGLLPLHAAVAARDGEATAWLGVSGTGKSTTLLRAARGGWHPVAEDLVWLDPSAGMAYGWDRAVRVWPDTLRRFFPDLDGSAGADGKLLIPYSALAGAAPRRARISRLAILARQPGVPSRWEPVAPHEVTRALWEATGVALSVPARDLASRAIAELVRRLPAARLVLGDDEPVLA